ncbi:hypothetical protein DBR43_03220 [Pedobacter sp. KBW06]|uniref:glycosyltransferase n=1 Tax=Pedobacter sp. KBW06 TaxID=2153359 RepID=UPI000F5B81E2|nr:glycosyltransferase family A protein [Pedobacter sp. KBW06]RQO74419.1 hypothetical protein DBR43_03220 [Pedobacter sp. KBW06]
MKKIAHVFVVIPFFNEAETLLDTCHSLGFGIDKPPGDDISLVLVNNNSSDASEYIAAQFKERFNNQSIYIFNQPTQGIVPTRIAGNQHVREICYDRKIHESLALIIQADADTIYSQNYINSMRIGADQAGLNTLIEADTRYPDTFINEDFGFLKACLEIDQACEKYFCDEHIDLIVDDKAVAYRLKDYYMWGGHQVVFNDSGDELLAETTRLFMKAKTFGAIRLKTTAAFVIHSVRNIHTERELVFATAGYPREAGWVKEFYRNNDTLNFDQDNRGLIVDLRILHLLGLFTILPAHFLNANGLETEKNAVIVHAMEYLPKRNIHEIRDKKIHLLIEDVFGVLNEKKDEFLILVRDK